VIAIKEMGSRQNSFGIGFQLASFQATAFIKIPKIAKSGQ
jgi:hypothetical protein